MSAEVVFSGPDERGVATLTLDRPHKRNALSIEVRDQMSDHLDRAAEDPAVKCVVVDSHGGAFCAGFDLAEFAVHDEAFQTRLWASSDRFHQTLLRFPLPTVAVVVGPALGGGFDLALMCDIRIATDNAVFAHPEQAFGDVAYALLESAVGGSVARYLALTGAQITAADALRMGLVSEVTTTASLRDVVATVTTQICRAPREALARTKAKAIERSAISASTRTLDL